MSPSRPANPTQSAHSLFNFCFQYENGQQLFDTAAFVRHNRKGTCQNYQQFPLDLVMSAISGFQGYHSGMNHGGTLSSARTTAGPRHSVGSGGNVGNRSASYSSSRQMAGSGIYQQQGQTLQGRGYQTSTGFARQTTIGSATTNRSSASGSAVRAGAGGVLGSGNRVGGYTTTTQRSVSTSGVCIPCGYNRR